MQGPTRVDLVFSKLVSQQSGSGGVLQLPLTPAILNDSLKR